jgi:ubiquitin-like protein Pup
MSEQAHAQHTERAEETTDEAIVSEAGKAAVKGAQETSEKAEDFLADIDELLGTEEEAQEFVDSYRQKGGQ